MSATPTEKAREIAEKKETYVKAKEFTVETWSGPNDKNHPDVWGAPINAETGETMIALFGVPVYVKPGWKIITSLDGKSKAAMSPEKFTAEYCLSPSAALTRSEEEKSIASDALAVVSEDAGELRAKVSTLTARLKEAERLLNDVAVGGCEVAADLSHPKNCLRCAAIAFLTASTPVEKKA